jgi:hypothetical protein
VLVVGWGGGGGGQWWWGERGAVDFDTTGKRIEYEDKKRRQV